MHLSFSMIKSWDLAKTLRFRNIILIFIVLTFFFVDAFPKLWRIGILREQIKAARRAMTVLTPQEEKEQERKLKAELGQITQQIQYLEQGVQEIKNKINVDKNIAVITLEVEDLATAAKVEVTSLTPQEGFPKDGYLILPLKIGLRSEYAQLMDFLVRVEGSSTAMSVQNLSIHKTNPVDPQLEVDVMLYILFFNAKENSVASETKGLK